MRKIIWIIALACLSAQTAKAQHSVALSWQNSPDTNNTFVYRLTGTCPATLTGFTKLTASPVTTAAFTDTAVNAGTTYAFYLTAFLNGVESIPSSCISVIIPVAPPSGLTIKSVTMNLSGGKETILAQWNNDSGAAQHFSFSDGKNFLGQGLIGPASGSFAETLTVAAGTTVIFSVDDASGQTARQQAN